MTTSLAGRVRVLAALALVAALTGNLVMASGGPELPGPEPVPPASYAGQWSLRWWGGVIRPDLYGARVALHDENSAMQSDSWTGAIPEGDLLTAVAGGVAFGWGATPDLKLTLDLDVAGAAAAGAFTGTGFRTAVDPMSGLETQRVARLTRLTETGQEAGVTLLVREFGWCRIGVAARVGWHELVASVERGRESGPYGTRWWNRALSASAPSLAGAVECEWLTPVAWLPFPLTGFINAGWRWLEFSTIESDDTDGGGAALHGRYNNPDGTHRTLSMTGPEIRIGLQSCWLAAPGQ